MKSIVVLFAFIGISFAQGSNRTNLLEIGQFVCEGKEGSNYTFITQWTIDAACSLTSYQGTGIDYLIMCQRNGQKLVNVLSVLAESGYVVGAYYQYEVLYLATKGNLEGKFLYIKEISLLENYLKKCSSVLGYSYTSTKSHVLLIAEKLDPNIFLIPSGAFELFKKSATTTCLGRSITV